MAKLDDFTSEIPQKAKITSQESNSGKKRRVWHESNRDSSVEGNNNSIIKKIAAEKVIPLQKLRKNPLLLINFLYDQIENKKQRITKKLTLRQTIETLNITRDSARTAIKFLMKNSIIDRVSFESGKEGGAIYKLSLPIYQDINKSRKF